jgi:hypothetical protein
MKIINRKSIFRYVILLIFVSIYFISLQCCHKQKSILPDKLLAIYGGIDLGESERCMKEKIVVIKEKDSDLDIYWAVSKSSDLFDLTIFNSGGWFFHSSKVLRIDASFSEKYIVSGHDTSLAYWIDNFSSIYHISPQHLLYLDGTDKDDSAIETFAWQLPDYSFHIGITHYFDKTKMRHLNFSAILNVDSLFLSRFYNEQLQILESGDTVKYNWSPKDIIRDNK